MAERPAAATHASRLGHRLTLAAEAVAALALFALMAMTCVDVAGRYLFNAPLDGATELTRLLMAGAIFAALPVISWREQHIVVDLLDRLTPAWLVAPRQVVISLAGAAALAFVARRVWLLAERSAEYGDRTEFLGLPVAPVVYYMAVMAGLTALALALNAVRYLRGHGPLTPPARRD